MLRMIRESFDVVSQEQAVFGNRSFAEAMSLLVLSVNPDEKIVSAGSIQDPLNHKGGGYVWAIVENKP